MSKRSKRSIYWFLSGYAFKYKWLFTTGILCFSAGLLLSLTIPEILRWFIDAALIKEKSRAISYLNILAVTSVSIYLVKGILSYLKDYIIAFAAHKTIRDMREDAFKRIEYFSLSFFLRKRTGTVISNLTNNFSTVEDFLINSVPDFFSQPIIIGGIIIMVFLTHWKLAIISLFVFPFIFFTINMFGKRTRRTGEKIQAGISEMLSFIQENLHNIRSVKIFRREEDEIERLRTFSKKNMSNILEGIRILAVMTPVIELISCIGLAVFFWYGGMEVINGKLTPGELIKFVTYISMLAPPLKNLSVDFSRYQKMKGAMKEIYDVFLTEDFINENEDAYDLPVSKGGINFKNVSFRYTENSKLVLNEISFTVSPGETIAVVGKSGAGKTSLVNLIPRLYDPESGKIEIDGHDIKNVKLDSLRKQIAVVPQEISLFHETIFYNIAYGRKNASREEVIDAARKAYAEGFINGLPDGYDTIVGERGETLSAGQKQRIAIARAILADPSILILDEATSSLDAESEQLVKEALEKFVKSRTTFIVAHRMSTIFNADRIIVLNGGKISESGTHGELLNLKGVYYGLYNKYTDFSVKRQMHDG